MSKHTPLPTLAFAMLELSQTIQSDDGIAAAVCGEAFNRFAALHRDLVLLRDAIAHAGASTPCLTAMDRALRAAADRLCAEADA